MDMPVMMSTFDSNDTDNDTASTQRYFISYKTAILTSFAVMVSFITILANMTIIIIASRDKKLRKMNSYLIINLAYMDLMVGLFVIPCMSAYNILGYWPLGDLICDLWTCVDFVCCTASFFNLSVISWDRFAAVTKPFEYRNQTRGKLHVVALIVFPWLMSILSWVPAIATWRVILGYAGDGQCIYLTDKYYVLLSNIFVYVIPMIIIVYLYARVYFALDVQMQRWTGNDNIGIQSTGELLDADTNKISVLETAQHNTHGILNTGFQAEEPDHDIQKINDINSISLRVFAADSQQKSIPLHLHQRSRDVTDGSELSMSAKTVSSHEIRPDVINRTPVWKVAQQERRMKYHLSRMKTHKRTTKTLGIIVAVFLICWIPWTVLYPINGFCRCVPNWMYIAGYWAAYLNSTFNPFLYGFNRDYRKAFKRIFIDRCFTHGMKASSESDIAEVDLH